MLKPQKPNLLKGQKQLPNWKYTPIKNGESAVGFLAGQPVGVFCHHVGQTRPCRRVMTESKLVCAHCEGGAVPVWRGYTPYYSREYTNCFVLISADYLESVSEIPLHSQIRLSRAKDQRAPVVIRPENWCTRGLPASPLRQGEQNIMYILLKLWKDEELIRYASTVQDDLPLQAKPNKDDSGVNDVLQKLLDKRKLSEMVPEPIIETYADAGKFFITDRNAKPSKNGTHKRA